MVWNILKLMLTRWLSMKRWNNFPRIEDVSHLDNVWFVMHVALFLSYLEEKEGHKIDREFLLKRIIFNSFSSLILSDISSGTRDYILKIDDKIFNEIEQKAFDFILWWNLEVRWVYGQTKTIKIPAWTKPWTKMRVKWFGKKESGRTDWNLLIKLEAKMPKHISDMDKQMLERISEGVGY